MPVLATPRSATDVASEASTVEKGRSGRVVVGLLVLLVPVTVVIFGVVAPAAYGDPNTVSEADRQLLIKVRQAGLWEIPAGQMAQDQAASQVVKDVGATIAEQHEQLDEEVSAVAAELGVELPIEASEEQLGWLDEMSTKSGPEFDAAYAQLLRAAHGKVFSVIAAVRAGTRNDAIREFAGKANEAVKTHMTLLESTGEVDFDALPEPALPGSTPTQHHDVAAASAQTGGPGLDVGIVIAICIVELVAVVGLLRVSRGR